MTEPSSAAPEPPSLSGLQDVVPAGLIVARESRLHRRLNTLLARLLISAAIPLVLFALVGLLAVVMVARLAAAEELEKHTREVLILAYKLQQSVEKMRGAVLSLPLAKVHDSRAYKDGRKAFRELAEPLRTRTADNLTQQERVRGLERRLEDLDQLLSRPDPRVQEGEVTEHLDALDGLITDLIRSEEELLDERQRAAERQNRLTVWVVLGAISLGLVLTVVFLLQSARSATRPIHHLRQAAGELVSGQFRTVPIEGPAEVADLIVLFNRMVLSVSQRASTLQRDEERYRSYLLAVAPIQWSADAHGEVAGDMPSWQKYTGQSTEACRGSGWLDAVHPEDRERVAAQWKQAVAERRYFETEYRLRSGRGEYRHFLARGVPIVTPGGQVREWIGTCTDITESKEQENLRSAKEAAEAASRAKSQFLAKMSHELRTPLNAVIGMSKMLSTQIFGPLNAKQADYLADITRAGEHLLALINDILDLAKVEAGKLELVAAPFGLAGAFETTLSTLRPLAAQRNLTLEVRPPRTDGTLTTDVGRLRQVLYNLLSNAIKYTREGGRVSVSWEWVREPVPDAEVVPEGEARAVRVAVRDTGVGIAPEHQELIWDEFRQLKSPSGGEQEGTGLGLALTRRLVGLLGGAIWLSSEVGKGSTFTFTLPRTLPRTPFREENGPSARPVAVVVEDYPPTSKLLCDWLTEAGLEAVPAFDGEAGLAEVRRRRPALVVLDIMLPRLDGWQVLTALKSDPATSSIPVVVVSVTAGEGNAPDEVRAAAATGQAGPGEVAGLGVQEFFVKPLDRDEFLARLRGLRPELFEGAQAAHVLLVEDDPLSRKLLADLLAAEGFRVSEAESGKEALQQLAQAVPDLVVLDLLMPEVDGFRVVEQMRAEPAWQEVPVLIVTSKDLTEEDRARLQGRIQALLTKRRLTAAKLREHLLALGLLKPASE